ncbi:polysaccharide pyruvyl transferase family protein [Mesoflavibacter zeaxanthinifaciens]|uniref:polysaccharide pyruvyl transferase family protein n=1 Tax=Mesoflavibacter zeaxanthinifaciens TaxID=393060 RepID=UPI003A94429E
MVRKKILVDIYLAKNLGDDLFLDHLSRSFPNIDFVPFHPGDNYRSFFKNYKNIHQFPYSFVDKLLARLGKNKLTDYNQLSIAYDGILFLGGGIFREESYWKEVYDYRKSIIEAFKSKDKNVFFSGCNFGPYISADFIEAYKEVFVKTDKIIFRDLKSYNLFSQLEETYYAPDLLWSYDLPEVKKNDKVLGISVIDPRHKEQYKHTHQEYITEHKKICNKYIELGFTIKLFSFCEPEGDLEIAEKIAEDFSSIQIVNYTSNISSYLKELGACSIFIAARFHAVIMAFKFGIPVIPIIYGDKTENLLRDLKYDTPFVFLNTVTTLNNSKFLTLSKDRISVLGYESKLHFDIKF